MNIIKKSIKASLFLGTLFTSTFVLAQDELAPEGVSAVQSTPIYEQLGISSTTLFAIMTIFTFLLLAVVWSMASSTKNILKYKQGEIKKRGGGTKALLALFALTFSTGVMAADGGAESTSLIPFPDSVFWAYIVTDVVLIMIMIYFAGIVKGSISDLVELRGLFKWKKLTLWTKKLTKAVPMEDEASILLDHDYDGITELDNQLPPWWKYGFYITVVWAFVYFFYYQVFEIGNLQEAEYLAEMEEGERQMAEYKAAHPEMITAENAELLTDAASIAQGRSIYDQKCKSCHMEGGAGGVGPNLSDDYWLHGGDMASVFTTISDGVPMNGMAAWKALLPANEIQAVASYILQLEFVEGKEPQGELVE
jgi:cytochrome c oxidase cbb3-type subunit 3